MLHRPFVGNIYSNLPFLGLVATLGILVAVRELRKQPPYQYPPWKLLINGIFAACCMSPLCSVLLVMSVIEIPKPPVVPAAPRCEIDWTLQIRNGVVEKKIPVVICEELNGKWITAKQ